MKLSQKSLHSRWEGTFRPEPHRALRSSGRLRAQDRTPGGGCRQRLVAAMPPVPAAWPGSLPVTGRPSPSHQHTPSSSVFCAPPPPALTGSGGGEQPQMEVADMLCGPHPYGLKTSMSFLTSRQVPLKFRPKKSDSCQARSSPGGGLEPRFPRVPVGRDTVLSGKDGPCPGASMPTGLPTARWPAGTDGHIRTHTAAGGRRRSRACGAHSAETAP